MLITQETLDLNPQHHVEDNLFIHIVSSEIPPLNEIWKHSCPIQAYVSGVRQKAEAE